MKTLPLYQDLVRSQIVTIGHACMQHAAAATGASLVHVHARVYMSVHALWTYVCSYVNVSTSGNKYSYIYVLKKTFLTLTTIFSKI